MRDEQSYMPQKHSVLIDFSSIRAGGGVQLALNFLKHIHSTHFSDFDLYYLLPSDGELAAQKETLGRDRTLSAPTNLVARLIFLRRQVRRFLRQRGIGAVFTFFGPGIPHPPQVVSLVGVAYPIICYPDSPFWKLYPVFARTKVRAMNFGRRMQLRQASMILAETEVMKSRLAKYIPFPKDRIQVIPPSVSLFIEGQEHRREGECRRFLLLSGVDFYKNLWRLYEVAELAERKQLNFQFVISSDRDRWIKTLPSSTRVRNEIVEKYFDFVGRISSDRIGQVYASCDSLLNLSDLESFSNNYMESWKMNLPLICSDRDFSRHICGGSAIYVEPHSPESIVNGIQQVMNSPQMRMSLVQEGGKKLADLPTLTERFNRIADLIQTMINEKKEGWMNP